MSFLREAKNLVLDAMFPRFCVGCGSEGTLLCRTCDEAWQPSLPLLSREGQGEVEPWSLVQYADPIARQLICAWKYQGDVSAWEILRRRFGPRLSLVSLQAALAGVQAVVPVSLHYRRRAERGFDQANEIAQWLATQLKIPVVHLLQRRATVGHQAERSDAERIAAMATTPFVCRQADVPKRVLLVDDVWTTGATMQAAAKEFTQKGSEVRFFTLAKG